MCRCSFYEIYNEHVYDLTVGEGEKVALNVREATGKGVFLEGLSEEEVRVCMRVGRAIFLFGGGRELNVCEGTCKDIFLDWFWEVRVFTRVGGGG